MKQHNLDLSNNPYIISFSITRNKEDYKDHPRSRGFFEEFIKSILEKTLSKVGDILEQLQPHNK